MFKMLLAATAVAAATLPAHAVTVVQWDFQSVTAPAAGTSWTGIAASTGTGTASGVHAAAATTWSTPVGNGSTFAASSNNWAVGDYWQFSFSTVGYTGVTLSYDQTGSGTGPRDFTLQYSLNGSTFTTVASYSLPAVTWASATTNSASTFVADLSGVTALNGASTVIVRLTDASTTSIAGGTVGTGGTSRVDNFIVMATPVPEPGTYALLLAGAAAVVGIARRRRAR